MSYKVKLDVFEGPLDLLLHLIEKEEVSIYEIPVARIAEQYLDYLHTARQMDIELTVEFLVIAATLLAIKSKMLLPQHPVEDEEDDEVELDPRRELMARLLEYKVYKEAAASLKKRQETTGRIYTRPVDVEGLIAKMLPGDPLKGVSVEDLTAALLRVFKRRAQEQDEGIPSPIVPRLVTIEEKMAHIYGKLQKSGRSLSFDTLFSPGSTREEIVVTFLALLELARMKRVFLGQREPFTEIEVALRLGQGGKP